MSKIPEWFSLDEYKNNLTPNEWAFEIFIRHKSKEKAEFIITHHPHSNSYDENILLILSEAFKKFDKDDAAKVINDNKDRLSEERFKWLETGAYSSLFIDDDRKAADRWALHECLKIYFNVKFLDLANFPIHLNLNDKEKQHIHNKFIEHHENVQAHPLIFLGGGGIETKEAGEYFEKNKVPHNHLGEHSYQLGSSEQIAYEKLFVKQPKASFESGPWRTRPFRPNFAFSNKEILEAVALYLEQNRQEETLGKNKVLKLLDGWMEHQILALWDLTQWCEWTGNTITQAKLATELWPYESRPKDNEVDYVERIRKVSKKYMVEAITERSYLLLLTSTLTLAE